MIINGEKLSTRSMSYLVIDVVILLAFLFFPFVSVGGLFSTSAAMLPIRLLGVMVQATTNSYSAYILQGVLEEAGAWYFLLLVYSLTWYVMLFWAARAIFTLFVKKNIEEFNKFSESTFLSSIISLVILVFLKYFIVFVLFVQANEYGFGGLVSSYATGLFKFGFGFYLIFIAAVVGEVLKRYLKDEGGPSYVIKNSNKSSKALKDLVNSGRDLISKTKQNIHSENTGDLLPVVTLTGDKVIELTTLPVTVGRNREEVDVCIIDKSISKKHCTITNYENMIVISDLGSFYGTKLNNEELDPGEFFQIMDGDTITFGNIDYKVTINEIILNKKYGQDNSKAVQPTPPAQSAEPVSKPASEPQRKAPEQKQVVDFREQERASAKSKREEPFIPIPPEVDLDKTVALSRGGNQTVQLGYQSDREIPIRALVTPDNMEVHLINKPQLTLGKDASRANIVISDNTVSGVHAVITYEDNDFMIEDMGSTNGTELNDKVLENHVKYVIRPGDIIRLGMQEYVFEEV